METETVAYIPMRATFFVKIIKIKNMTKQELQARVQQINQQISQLHDEGIKIVGKLELLEEQEKATVETPK